VAKNTQVYELTDSMNALGREGWELVTSLTTVKTWMNVSGNDLVFVFKKPGADQTISGELATLLAGLDPTIAY
jgi:hypothetical protein